MNLTENIFNILKTKPKMGMIARVNHKDNFTLWATPKVWMAILDSFGDFNGYTDKVAMEQYNQICDACTVAVPGWENQAWRAQWGEVRPSKSPLVLEICHKLYEELNKVA